jgi:APA family basic amino acid/polyamine antiporter
MATGAVGLQGVFVRKSSGLIRTAGVLDVFIYNLGLISIGIAVAFNQYYGPALYPGSNVVASTFIAGAGMIFISLSFYFWSIIFPRSGGNYVYQSRALGPTVALPLSVLDSTVTLFYSSLAAFLFATVGVSAGLGSVGLITKSDALTNAGNWAGSPWGIFIIGSLALIIFGGIPMFGMKRFFWFQKLMMAIALGGLVVTVIVLIGTDQSAFTSNFNRITGLNYNDVITAAHKNGYAFTGYTLGPTVSFMVWPLLAYLGAVLSIGIGGEIKQVTRSQFVGIVGSVAVAAVAIAIVSALANRSFGYEFQGALAYNALTGHPDGSTPVAPWVTLLASIAVDNPVIAVIIAATFAAWIYFWIPAELIYPQRAMLAWSFDRLAPEAVSYVSPRFHTPLVAIAISIIVCIIFLAVIAFTTLGSLVFIMGAYLVWGITMAVGVVFPYLRPQMFNSSAAARYKVAGIPVMSIVSAVATLFFAWALYLLWNDPVAAGHNPVVLETLGGVLVVGIILYVVMFVVRRRQGIDVSLAFKEIPIE